MVIRIQSACSQRALLIVVFSLCCARREFRGVPGTQYLILQHHFGILVFRALSHTGGMVDRAGRFGVSWKAAGGLDQGWGSSGSSGDTVPNRGVPGTQYLILQHHFGIGVFRALSHTGGMVDRAGRFGVSWKSAGGLDHGCDRTARSGGTVAEVARAFRPLLWTTRVPGAFLGVSSWTAPVRRSQECGADGHGLWWAVAARAADPPKHCLGLAAVPHGFSLGGSGRRAGKPGGVLRRD